MLVIVQIRDAQNQEVTRRVRATSRRIASKVAEVLHDVPVTLRSRSSRLRPNPNCDGAYGSQKRDTKNSHQRRGGRNDAFGRFRDTETASRPVNGAESRASLALIRKYRRRLDCLAVPPRFEPGTD